MTRLNLTSLFWDFYAFFYDRMCDLSPYQKLLGQVYGEFLSFGCKDGRFLDAGCGTGRLCKLLLNRGGDVWVYGVDCSLPMLKQAMRKCNSQKAVFMPISLDETLPFPDSFFDGIFCIHVLYALKDPLLTLKEFYRTLKEGGAVIIVNPVSGATLRQHASKELIRKDGLRILRDMPFHIIMALINLIITTKSKNKTFYAYTEKEMEKILKQTGFKNINIHRVYDDTSLLTVAVKLGERK